MNPPTASTPRASEMLALVADLVRKNSMSCCPRTDARRRGGLRPDRGPRFGTAGAVGALRILGQRTAGLRGSGSADRAKRSSRTTAARRAGLRTAARHAVRSSCRTRGAVSSSRRRATAAARSARSSPPRGISKRSSRPASRPKDRMPIFDQTYQHWTGTPQHRSPAWILGRAQLRIVLARKTTRILLIVAGIFMLVWAALVYFETQVVRVGPLADIAGAVRVEPELPHLPRAPRLVHWLLCLAVADIIALDRRARPCRSTVTAVTVVDYVLGKAVAVIVPLSLATWFQVSSSFQKSALRRRSGLDERPAVVAVGDPRLRVRPVVPLTLSDSGAVELVAQPRPRAPRIRVPLPFPVPRGKCWRRDAARTTGSCCR